MFLPGQPFTFTASPGDKLQFATMFVQSNDLFFASWHGGTALFDAGGRAVHGKVTSQAALFDAGTEVNQAPGAGSDQAPRQAKPDTGAAEQVAIAPAADRRDGFAYPPIEAVIDVEIMPLAGGSSRAEIAEHLDRDPAQCSPGPCRWTTRTSILKGPRAVHDTVHPRAP